MAFTAVQTVRLKTGLKVVIARETVQARGSDKYFKLKNEPIEATPAIEVRQNNTLLAVGSEYTVDVINGIVSLVTAPPVGIGMDFTYYWSVYTDDELQAFIDDSSSNLNVAAANVLLALAADAARIAKRQTLIGGGGIGQSTIDTSVAAKELRATAQAYMDAEAKLGDVIPAEGFTSVPWTEAVFLDQRDQSIIRNS